MSYTVDHNICTQAQTSASKLLTNQHPVGARKQAVEFFHRAEYNICIQGQNSARNQVTNQYPVDTRKHSLVY